MDYQPADKYHQMLRAFARLKRVNTDHGNQISNTDARDTAEDFFNQCYHFKDWMKQGYPHLSTAIEAHITNGDGLSLAADLCNSFKHGGLNRPPRSGKSLDKINTHIKFELSPKVVASSRLELTIDGKRQDAFSLATDCIREWDDFLHTQGIVFPNP